MADVDSALRARRFHESLFATLENDRGLRTERDAALRGLSQAAARCRGGAAAWLGERTREPVALATIMREMDNASDGLQRDPAAPGRLCACLQVFANLSSTFVDPEGAQHMRSVLRRQGFAYRVVQSLDSSVPTVRLLAHAAVQNCTADAPFALQISALGAVARIEAVAVALEAEAGDGEASIEQQIAAFAAGSLSNICEHWRRACSAAGLFAPVVHKSARRPGVR